MVLLSKKMVDVIANEISSTIKKKIKRLLAKICFAPHSLHTTTLPNDSFTRSRKLNSAVQPFFIHFILQYFVFGINDLASKKFY